MPSPIEADPSLTNPGFHPPTQAEQSAWYDVIGKLRAKIAEFEDVYNKITSKANIIALSPVLTRDYNNWLRRANVIKLSLNGINGVRAKMSSAWTWLKGVVGFSGLGLGPLGWAIGAAIAFLGTMTLVAKDGWMFNKKVEFVQLQVANGVSMSQAVANANKMTKNLSSPWFNINTKYLAVGASVIGGLWLWFKMRGSR